MHAKFLLNFLVQYLHSVLDSYRIDTYFVSDMPSGHGVKVGPGPRDPPQSLKV